MGSVNTPVQVAIAGGGIIGLALGLELRLRGFAVTVLERGQAMRGASWAAGGMLAAEDPQNPPALMPLARLSARLYPVWLRTIEEWSGLRVTMRTQYALQWVEPEMREGSATAEQIRELVPALRPREGVQFRLLEEASVDPRDLCVALPKAFAAAGGKLIEGCEVVGVEPGANEVRVITTEGELAVGHFVNCCGAWAGAMIEGLSPIPVEPVKGQMVELQCDPERLKCVIRAPEVYLIPRGDGRVTVGSTLERVGFDERVDPGAVAALVRTAQTWIPELKQADPLTCWAGLRPDTPDGLPVVGPAQLSEEKPAPRYWHATGHYRDGILLAPATARVMAQAIASERTDVSLEAFAAVRFAQVPR